jgi:hypothetical protein
LQLSLLDKRSLSFSLSLSHTLGTSSKRYLLWHTVNAGKGRGGKILLQSI